jgi:hypothetical protein
MAESQGPIGGEEGTGCALCADLGGFWLPPSGAGADNSSESQSAGNYRDGLNINPLYRESSRWLFDNFYTVSQDTDGAWTGDRATCNAGTSSPAVRNAVLARVNYYRAMSGVPAIHGLVEEHNNLAQQAALVMSVNGRLAHWPDESWSCYSPEGYAGASHSLLFLSGHAAAAVDAYVEDRGGGNGFVPHRRMLLYPHTKTMGTGDVPAGEGFLAANALWVLGSMSAERPETRDGFVAWPPPGYVPHEVVFPRWSFSYPEADLTRAEVHMAAGGRELELLVLPVVDGFGESTIVWEPLDMAEHPSPEDRWISVSVRDVLVEKRTYNFSYTVIVFDPAS